GASRSRAGGLNPHTCARLGAVHRLLSSRARMAAFALRSELATPAAGSLRRAVWRSELGEGDVLGGSYRLLAPIGRGGMSVVFEAAHVRLGHRVAVKLMAPLLADDAVALARFRREAELLATL